MIEKRQFGNMPNGQTVDAYTLTNDNGMSIDILTLGATIRSWKLAQHNPTDVVLGFDSVDDYLADQGYMGRTVGRYANRIEKGQFQLNGETYNVSTNLQGNSLHGGVVGFHNRIWKVSDALDRSKASIILRLTSEDGDQGFPGNLRVDVTFTLDDNNCLTIDYRARSDQDTVFNPTQHSYFNLAGHDSGAIYEQRINAFASHYTPANNQAIPSGEIKAVRNTAFDLNQSKTFGSLIHQPDPEIQTASGLDHNWCVDGFKSDQSALQLAAEVTEPATGRKLLVRTSMPGIQIYTGNFIGTSPVGKGGVTYAPYSGFCIESQFYPNSPNQTGFPSSVLKANATFVSSTSYQIIEAD
ncbi:aldose epimerase family protein [Aliiglaciecola litoralis]|uniref:Aldose 1-epimerase n=1 Tax=Aliiglaciecola litoralis TaxID=582857 RepID=A0ABP3WQV6_9ALTE